MFSRLFGKAPPSPPAEPDEPVVIVPIPPLVTLLLALRKEKCAELTEAEVLEYRDNAICMTMRLSHARQLAEKRGYDDLDMENAWEDWQAFLKEYDGAAPEG